LAILIIIIFSRAIWQAMAGLAGLSVRKTSLKSQRSVDAVDPARRQLLPWSAMNPSKAM
jgi:hypothetical protein